MAPVIARSAAAALADGGTSRDRPPLGSATRRFDTILHVLEVVLKDLPAADPETRVALYRLTEALGRIVNLPPQPQEGLGAFAKRLIAHMEQMPPTARALLDKQLTQQSLIAALKLLVESLRNGTALDLLPKGEMPLPPGGPPLHDPDETPFRPPVIQQPLPVHAAPTHPSTAIGSAPELQAALRQAFGAGEAAAAQGAEGSLAPDDPLGPGPAAADRRADGAAAERGSPIDDMTSIGEPWDQGPFAGEPIPALKEAAAYLAKDPKAMARAVEITAGATARSEPRQGVAEPSLEGAAGDVAELAGDHAAPASTTVRRAGGAMPAADLPHARLHAETLIGPTRPVAGTPVPASPGSQARADAQPPALTGTARPLFAHPASAAVKGLVLGSASGASGAGQPAEHLSGPAAPVTQASTARASADEPARPSRLPERAPQTSEGDGARLLPPPASVGTQPLPAAPARSSFDEWEMLFSMLAGPREEGELPPSASLPPSGDESSNLPSETPAPIATSAATAQAAIDAGRSTSLETHAAHLPPGETATSPLVDAQATQPFALPAASVPNLLLPFLAVPYPPLPEKPPIDEEAEPQHQGAGDEDEPEPKGEQQGGRRGKGSSPDEGDHADAEQLYRHLADLS